MNTLTPCRPLRPNCLLHPPTPSPPSDLALHRAPFTWAAIAQRRDDRHRYIDAYVQLALAGGRPDQRDPDSYTPRTTPRVGAAEAGAGETPMSLEEELVGTVARVVLERLLVSAAACAGVRGRGSHCLITGFIHSE